MRFQDCPRYKSVLTNGEVAIEIQYSRFSCGINPPPGVVFAVYNGDCCINGKHAWIEIVEY